VPWSVAWIIDHTAGQSRAFSLPLVLLTRWPWSRPTRRP